VTRAKALVEFPVESPQSKVSCGCNRCSPLQYRPTWPRDDIAVINPGDVQHNPLAFSVPDDAPRVTFI
jgi:hypothetical protein